MRKSRRLTTPFLSGGPEFRSGEARKRAACARRRRRWCLYEPQRLASTPFFAFLFQCLAAPKPSRAPSSRSFNRVTGKPICWSLATGSSGPAAVGRGALERLGSPRQHPFSLFSPELKGSVEKRSTPHLPDFHRVTGSPIWWGSVAGPLSPPPSTRGYLGWASPAVNTILQISFQSLSQGACESRDS
jgi:hypothetical protein